MAKRSRVIDGTLLLLLGLLGVLAFLAWQRGGVELVGRGLADGGGMLMRFGPLVIVSFLAAGFAEILLPVDWVRQRLGADSGITGILLGAGAGIITPAGPFVSMPIAAVMARSGAGMGPIVAFLTGWSLLALHRFVAWELPILGPRLAVLRYAVSIVLPVLAGLAARAITKG